MLAWNEAKLRMVAIMKGITFSGQANLKLKHQTSIVQAPALYNVNSGKS